MARTGQPVSAYAQSNPAKRSVISGRMPAKRWPMPAWPLPRKLIAKAPARSTRAWLGRWTPRQTETSGGLRLTEENELAVMPCGRPSTTVVTTPTPLGHWARAERNVMLSTDTGRLSVSHQETPLPET